MRYSAQQGEPRAARRSAGRVAVSSGTVLFLAVLGWLCWPGSDRVQTAPNDASARARGLRNHHRHVSARLSTMREAIRQAPAPDGERKPSPPPRIDVRQAKLIEAVALSNATPCLGEEVLVHVTPRARAREAKIFVAGRPGNPGVLRYARTGLRQVPIVARSWFDEIERRQVTVDVKACRAQSLLLSVQEMQGQVLLRVLPFAGQALVHHYEWELGDGSFAQTQHPVLEHDYRLRAQTAPISSFLVKAVAVGGRVSSVSGHATVTLVNADYIARRSGAPTLAVRGQRFATVDGREASVALEVKNDLAEDLQLQSAEVRGFPCAAGDAPVTLNFEARQVLDRRGLTQGAVSDLVFTLPLERFDQRLCRAQVWLRARSSEGPVRAPFAMELDVPDDARPLTDPRLRASVLQAMRRAGRTRLTPAELLALDAAVARQ